VPNEEIELIVKTLRAFTNAHFRRSLSAFDNFYRIIYDTSMNKCYQIVMETNVLISALRSRRGPSFKMLSLIGKGRFEINLSVPLVLEYEAVAKRSRWQNKPSWVHVSNIIDYLCEAGRQQPIHFLWRPRARDPKDDMVLEVAVAGHCDGIVTYNKKDFAEAKSFGLELFTPKEFLEKIGELK
jgi:putative PIN family toxin of toxin-antitoxin system